MLKKVCIQSKDHTKRACISDETKKKSSYSRNDICVGSNVHVHVHMARLGLTKSDQKYPEFWIKVFPGFSRSGFFREKSVREVRKHGAHEKCKKKPI